MRRPRWPRITGRLWLGPTPLTSTPGSKRSRSAAFAGERSSIRRRVDHRHRGRQLEALGLATGGRDGGRGEEGAILRDRLVGLGVGLGYRVGDLPVDLGRCGVVGLGEGARGHEGASEEEHGKRLVKHRVSPRPRAAASGRRIGNRVGFTGLAIAGGHQRGRRPGAIARGTRGDGRSTRPDGRSTTISTVGIRPGAVGAAGARRHAAGRGSVAVCGRHGRVPVAALGRRRGRPGREAPRPGRAGRSPAARSGRKCRAAGFGVPRRRG